MKNFVENKSGYKVWTDSGWQDFAGVALMGERPIYRIEIDDKTWIEASPEHKVYITDMKTKLISMLHDGETIMTLQGPKKVNRVVLTDRKEKVYDLIEVNGNHRYYTNGILSSNCEFIQFDETLVNPLTLASLHPQEPTITGQTRWYGKIEPNKIYIVSLDPSMGTGGDASAIEVFQLPEMKQVAEWKHHKTTIPNQIRILREILKTIYDEMKANPEQVGEPELYWTVENNTVGEGALIVIEQTGEDKFPGTMVHEPKSRGHFKRYRKGLNTTHKTKIAACARLKSLIESGRMFLYSQALISELKNYVASGTTFKAKPGSNDDLVTCLLLCIRILDIVSNWNTGLTERLSEAMEFEDAESTPMPVTILLS